VLSRKIADEIAEIEGVEEVEIYLLSQIGYPINDPAEACARVITSGNTTVSELESEIEEVMKKNIEHVKQITDLVVEGKLTVF
jgi:S-adenosylmethionine synthetase